jgi:hypothetical protein
MAHVGDLLDEMLMRYGVTDVFGQPGGQTAALYDGIARRGPHLRHILVRDECSAQQQFACGEIHLTRTDAGDPSRRRVPSMHSCCSSSLRRPRRASSGAAVTNPSHCIGRHLRI